jgi:hypothetical protein
MRPKTNGRKALQLVCWNTDGMCGRKLKLEEFRSEHGVDISLLNETHLKSGRSTRFAHVCHRTENRTLEGGSAIPVRRGVDHYAVPVSGLQHLKSSAKHQVLATSQGKVSTYLSPTQPLMESDLTELLSVLFPVLMSGDLNAKHKDWSSSLITAQSALLSDYAKKSLACSAGRSHNHGSLHAQCYSRHR